MLKRVNKVFSLTFICVTAILFVAAQSNFQSAIGMEGFEKGSSLRVLDDGSFIIAGETESYGQIERDMLLMHADSTGHLIWTRTFGGPERETLNDVIATADHGFIATAEKYQPNKVEGEHLTLLKTDVTGNLLWKKIYDEGGNETEGFSIQHTPDNNYVIAGMIKSMTMVSNTFFDMRAEDQHMYLIKVDGSGNKVWSRSLIYGEENVGSTGTSVIITTDGSYLVAGNIAKMGRTDKKIEKPAQTVNMEDTRTMLLTKVKPNGNLQWAREFQSNQITMGYTVIEKREGGFVVVGNTSVSKFNLDIFAMSLDANGNVLWAKTFGGKGFESVADVLQLPDGGFVVSGFTKSFGSGSSDVLTFKLKKTGDVEWSKTYGGKSEEYPSKLALTKSGIVTVGSTASFTSEGFDVLLFKTDFNGNGSCIGTNVTMNVGALVSTSHAVKGAAMQKVEQGIVPPHMVKPNPESIKENKREARVKNLCN